MMGQLRVSNNVLLCVAALSVAVGLLAAPAAGQSADCAEIGTFCIYHSDCCSNSCLNVIRRCVGPAAVAADEQPNEEKPATHGPHVTPVVGTPTTLQNRFSDTADMQQTQKHPLPPASSSSSSSLPPQNGCTNNGDYCTNHSDCCSGNCFLYSYQCVKRNQPPHTTSAVQRPVPQQPQQQHHHHHHHYNGPATNAVNSVVPTQLNTRFGESNTSASKCGAVGETCNVHDQCCSLNCNRFAAKCVTSGQNLQDVNGRPIAPPTTQIQQPSINLDNRFGEGTGAKCAAFGATCHQHTDCCSLNCNRFGARCITSSQLIQDVNGQPVSVSVVPQQSQPSGSASTTVLGNRFGESDSLASKNPNASLFPPQSVGGGPGVNNIHCYAEGSVCDSSKDCCSEFCEQSECRRFPSAGAPTGDQRPRPRPSQ